jgi:hypothetical protein
MKIISLTFEDEVLVFSCTLLFQELSSISMYRNES